MATIEDARKKVADIQANIDRLGRFKKHEEGQSISTHTGNDAFTRAAAAARAKVYAEQIGYLKQDLADANNELWTATGEYDKLLAGSNRDAYAALHSMFKGFGLESLAGKIYDFVKNGYSADTISLLLQDTPEYKDRFAGNEIRKKQGLPVLSAGEYLATEAAYRQVMESAGLPRGFYDNKNDFSDLIGKNVSPTEVQNRVDLAVQATTMAPENVKQALKQITGLTEGDMVAYFLDEEKAMPLLNKSIKAAQIGAQALAQGLSFDVGYTEGLAMAGITAEQARQGYSSLAQEMTSLSTLGEIYGVGWSQREGEQVAFEGNAAASEKRKRLASQERGAFSGSAGTARGGLAQRGGAR